MKALFPTCQRRGRVLHCRTTHCDSVNRRVVPLKTRRGRDSDPCFSAGNSCEGVANRITGKFLRRNNSPVVIPETFQATLVCNRLLAQTNPANSGRNTFNNTVMMSKAIEADDLLASLVHCPKFNAH
ncbi:hypothetical protein Y032_0267g748 [Ancylostoma ceylanicum]|uniref:Uncharacterized protein n=1 Tax=Ancylostoma ceylanicum TaxID=53326 RepID=A0A016SA59_9BILA|nr:hypothetical protein Y032_0267g748 [Ancylostoma ceylanicum]